MADKKQFIVTFWKGTYGVSELAVVYWAFNYVTGHSTTYMFLREHQAIDLANEIERFLEHDYEIRWKLEKDIPKSLNDLYTKAEWITA